MLKKILVSGLVGSMLLSLPVLAKTSQSGTSPVQGSKIAQNSVSAGDQREIRQLIERTIQATNNGKVKEVIAGISPNYQDGNGGKNSYRNFRSGVRMTIAFLQAYGIKISAQNIQITSAGRNRATVNLSYKVDFSPEVLEEMTPEEQKRFQESQAKGQNSMIFTVEKTNGRWLIAGTQSPSQSNNGFSAPVAGGTMTVSGAPADPSKPASPKDREAIRALFNKHIQALNREDLAGYLATLDSTSAKYQEVKQQTAQLFQDYNLKFELKSLSIVSINGNSGVVKMVATAKRISGGNFNDSKIVTYNTITKSQGKWRIADTEVESMTALR
jgi:hypothetical protein